MKVLIFLTFILTLNLVQSQCLKECGNGSCLNETNFCFCDEGFAGPYCDISVNKTIPIYNLKEPYLFYPEGNYSVGMLREVDPQGNIVYEYNINYDDWTSYPHHSFGGFKFDRGNIFVDQYYSTQRQIYFFDPLPLYNNTVFYDTNVYYNFSSKINSLELLFYVNTNSSGDHIKLENSFTFIGQKSIIHSLFPPIAMDSSFKNITPSISSVYPFKYSIKLPYFESSGWYRTVVTVYEIENRTPITSSPTTGSTNTNSATTGQSTTSVSNIDSTTSITTYVSTGSSSSTSSTTTGPLTSGSPSTTTYSPTTSTTSPNGDEIETSTTTTSSDNYISTNTITTRYSSDCVTYTNSTIYSDGYQTKTTTITTIVKYSGFGSITTSETVIIGTVVSTNTSSQKRKFNYIHGQSNLQNLESTLLEEETSDSSKLQSFNIIILLLFSIILILH